MEDSWVNHTVESPINAVSLGQDSGKSYKQILQEKYANIHAKVFDNENWSDGFSKSLLLLDHTTFQFHRWFQGMLRASYLKTTTIQQLTNRYLERLNRHVFNSNPYDKEKLRAAHRYLIEWCESARPKISADDGTEYANYAIDSVQTVEAFFEWYYTNKAKEQDAVAYKHFVSRYVRSLNTIMVVQGWLASPGGNKTDIPLNDKLKDLKEKLGNRILEIQRLQNITIDKARLQKRMLRPAEEENVIKAFNSLHANTPSRDLQALLQFAILAINHNLGFRGGQVRRFRYSWLKYEESQQALCGGIYLQIGNPGGSKVRRGDFLFTQYIVRHIVVDQCPIGALARLMVAEHDIFSFQASEGKGLIDLIEESIDAREAFLKMETSEEPPKPEWWNYHILHNDRDTQTEVGPSMYQRYIKDIYQQTLTRSPDVKGHEPRNRVGAKLLDMGVDVYDIIMFMGWQAARQDAYTRFYAKAGIQVKVALARSGYPGWNNFGYTCRRDNAINEALHNTGFDTLRKHVFGDRIPKLYERALIVNEALRQRNYDDLADHAATMLLELIDRFLIRVWLEDAALLYPKYPDSLCYKNHPIFTNPDLKKPWEKFSKHMMNRVRGSSGAIRRTQQSLRNSESVLRQPMLDPTEERLKKLMKQVFSDDVTILALYTWRMKVLKYWQEYASKTHTKARRKQGPSNEFWGVGESTKSGYSYGGNRTLFQYLSHITEYIRRASIDQQLTVRTVIQKLQEISAELQMKQKAFATQTFRILASRSPASPALPTPLTKAQLNTRLASKGLPHLNP